MFTFLPSTVLYIRSLLCTNVYTVWSFLLGIMVGFVIWEERFARTDRVFVGVFPEGKDTFFWPDNTILKNGVG